MNILLVTEGSGGHLIPALQVASTLAARGARIKVWFAERRQTVGLTQALTLQARHDGVEFDPIPVDASAGLFSRLRQCGALWRRAERCFGSFSPDAVIGFGGWVSAPVLLAAKRHGIGCLVHEQNVQLGKANRLLSRVVNRVAVSFAETQAQLKGASSVVTGMPVRDGIGRMLRAEAARRLGLSPDRPTVLVLGGSQGARAINAAMAEAVKHLTPAESASWQLVHVTGTADEDAVRALHATTGVAAWVGAYLADMDAAYALSDVAVARAGASTLAELARCGLPAVLIPYPHAGGHQRANARVIEAAGGGVLLEEADASPERVLAAVRRLLGNAEARAAMGERMRTLSAADAAERLAQAIVELAGHPAEALSSAHAAR